MLEGCLKFLLHVSPCFSIRLVGDSDTDGHLQLTDEEEGMGYNKSKRKKLITTSNEDSSMNSWSMEINGSFVSFLVILEQGF